MESNDKVLREFRENFTFESKDSDDVWLRDSGGNICTAPYLRYEVESFLSTKLTEAREEGKNAAVNSFLAIARKL